MFKMKKKGLILVGALSMLALASCGASKDNWVELEHESIIYYNLDNKCYDTKVNCNTYGIGECDVYMCEQNENVKLDLQKKYNKDYGYTNIVNTSFDIVVDNMVRTVTYSNTKHIMRTTEYLDYHFTYTVTLDNNDVYKLNSNNVKNYKWSDFGARYYFLTKEECEKSCEKGEFDYDKRSVLYM